MVDPFALSTLRDAIQALLWTQEAVREASGDFDRVLEAVVEGALRTMSRAEGAVVEWVEGDEMVYRAAAGAAKGQEGLRLSIHSSLSGFAVLNGQSVLCPDTDLDPRVDREACRRIGVRAMVIVPLRDEAGVVGVLKIFASQPDALSEVELLTTQLLAGPINAGMTRVAMKTAEQDRDRAQAAARAKSSFLANMSHEIRTPMNGVIGFGDLLLRTELSAEQRRYAGLIVDSAKAMLTILNDILDFSKIEAGQLDIVHEPFDLPQALEQAARLLTASAEGKGLVLKVEVDPGLPQHVYGDAFRLRQIVLNLIGNAVKFTPRGEVTLRARRLDAGEVEICIDDTGIGIPADRLQSILNEFVQADAGTARRYGGSGLGLSISKKLAELMGGTLSIQSIESRGTTVTVRAPFPEATPVALAPAQAASIAQAAASHILLAEDMDINQELVGAMLTALGHTFEIAADGAEAIRLFEKPPGGRAFDLILMDLHMPGVNGLEAARQIHAEAPKVPIVALTASAFAEEIEACFAAGMVDHLTKPITQDVLGAALAKHLPRIPPRAAMAGAAAKLADKYRERKAEALDQLKALTPAVEAGDSEALAKARSVAHGLSGVCGAFGEPELGLLASAAEELIRDPDRAPADLLAALERLRTGLADAL